MNRAVLTIGTPADWSSRISFGAGDGARGDGSDDDMVEEAAVDQLGRSGPQDDAD